jgi:hypothetical protein
MSPHDSNDLTEVIENESNTFVVLRSAESAEHTPDYRKLGRFQTREEAVSFLAAYEPTDNPS